MPGQQLLWWTSHLGNRELAAADVAVVAVVVAAAVAVSRLWPSQLWWLWRWAEGLLLGSIQSPVLWFVGSLSGIVVVGAAVGAVVAALKLMLMQLH